MTNGESNGRGRCPLAVRAPDSSAATAESARGQINSPATGIRGWQGWLNSGVHTGYIQHKATGHAPPLVQDGNSTTQKI